MATTKVFYGEHEFITCEVCKQKTKRRSTNQLYCLKCKEEKRLEWKRANSKKRWATPEIRERMSAYMKNYSLDYHSKNKELINEKQRAKRLIDRKIVIEHYGGKCACCGEDTFAFLAIDHTNGGGNKHRKELKVSSIRPDWFIRSNFPDGFRVLCHNCNMALAYYPLCPHQNSCF